MLQMLNRAHSNYTSLEFGCIAVKNETIYFFLCVIPTDWNVASQSQLGINHDAVISASLGWHVAYIFFDCFLVCGWVATVS